ncbi:MAG: AraC family transcriptional regulator [Defluviitaleaceae bacterium]|nr:AraC family transcriptional regulator [Defluviitaleaceae bacterium]MCL2274724.1 AraC family transcriptional regulator [Defluviitaleaceae bacterium]
MLYDDFNNAVPVMEYFNYRVNTPAWQIEPAQTDFIDISYVINGRAEYTIDGRIYTVNAGDLLCIPAGSSRSAISNEPEKFAGFAANFFMRSAEGADVTIPLPLISPIGIHEDVISLYKKLNVEWLRRSPGYTMRVRAFFMTILQRYMAMLVYEVDTYRFDPRVKTAIRYITDHYSEPMHITQVAHAVSLNPVYFGALFKKETQVSFRDYLNMIRLNQAEDMLRTGEWNVTEVALRCGFGDVFYFSRLYKKHKGVPPSSVLG